jgi:hypothetical protein
LLAWARTNSHPGSRSRAPLKIIVANGSAIGCKLVKPLSYSMIDVIDSATEN